MVKESRILPICGFYSCKTAVTIKILRTVQVKYLFKIKKNCQNRVFGDNLNLLTLKTKFGTTMDFPENLENSITLTSERSKTNIWDAETYKNKLEMVFFYQNCSDLL